MPRIFKFTEFSLRDLLVTVGPMTLLIVLACYVAYRLVDPTPPSHVTLSTGQENSAYEQFGKKYADTLARYGITVTLQPSLGSQENLRRLNDPGSVTDIAFVQSGSTEHDEAERAGLISLGSLFTEPVWLFFRENRIFTQLKELKGRKVNVGPEGTGVPRLFTALLSVNGIEPSDVRLSELEDTPATVALLDGSIDALVFSSAPDSLLVQMLLQTPGIKLFDFSQAEAYSRRFPYLSHVTLPRGIVDLGKDLPSKNYHLIAPTATLVAREDLHPALIDLFVQTATAVHGGAGWFRKQGEFPNASYTEIPVVPEAEKFYREGPPFLQRYMPFWLANFLERMWVVIVALGALFLPLSRIIPPLYVWKVRSRVYRWYGQLRSVEQAIEEVPPARRADVYPAQLKRLAQLEERVNQITIPLSFADELYRLRSNINLVRKRILWLSENAPESDRMSGAA
ncbi:TAXI family TRAP transporter solute-binding subunit [Oxalicibacterium faecigallinarum]|uniref:C4-dicarboxylate ABC transporter substrate-binding protein n=1 Tax=Oxalicibacterium faecigallinarum TaxID=573741 RepID=A0A8J3ASN9_9BURK|nr:TAXI family TRAP transporter solute-binding subunit [Oxalicibacterium faecigallinarum]GGI18114.1 C4-dicarboxylate ABC transporter substrate-binding protein [Oxalicibacterium faecigallinarum]